MTRNDPEYSVDSQGGFSLRPDILYTINRTQTHEDEDYNLKEEEDGFHCPECGWRNLTLPMQAQADNVMDAVCPECGEPGVRNMLSIHVDTISEIFQDSDVDSDEFLPYSHFRDEFDAPQDRLDEAVNHLITERNAHIVMEDGEPLINISR